MLDLQEKRDARYKSLSGGQKQRVSIALALVRNPKVAILDELSTDRGQALVAWERPVLRFPTVLLVGQAVIAPELREIASGDTRAGTPFYRVSVINVILPAILALPIARGRRAGDDIRLVRRGTFPWIPIVTMIVWTPVLTPLASSGGELRGAYPTAVSGVRTCLRTQEI